MSRSKVTRYGHFCTGTKIASSGLLRYVELFIIRVNFAIYYFLHFNKVCQVAARLRAKSAIYDCLVVFVVSAKFGHKVLYVSYLHELAKYLPLDQLIIPQRVRE